MFIELQVRTILDEAWCECSHDYLYKNHDEKYPKYELEKLSQILAKLTSTAESITTLMSEKCRPEEFEPELILLLEENVENQNNIVRQRIENFMTSISEETNEFDGDIDHLRY
jgi:ppGpp synthetase/RelA/SpoT-type nucleotidyltranferase